MTFLGDFIGGLFGALPATRALFFYLLFLAKVSDNKNPRSLMAKKIYRVVPATKTKYQASGFDYYGPADLKPGTEVQISLGRKKIPGIIWNQCFASYQPSYPLKEISKYYPAALSSPQLKLASWISHYYHSPLGLVIKQFLPQKTTARRQPQISKNLLINPQKITLTSHQEEAWRKIRSGYQNNRANQNYLLYGVTGSGKTEVYCRLIDLVLRQDRQVIFLIPEIGLTSQIIGVLAGRFGPGIIALLHSQLSAGEKYYYWQKIAANEAKIIVGPRSAIFAPAHHLGAIIIDEEHDASFKQFDQNPRYHARQVAAKLAQLFDVPLLLGSATPAIETFYAAKKNNKTELLSLPTRANQQKLPPISIIDMRQELRHKNFSPISENLQHQIQANLQDSRQTLIFVNRRGFSTFIMCRDCGQVIECPRCQVPLIYHFQRKNRLYCHHCDFQQINPSLCPQCQSPKIKYFGIGTEKVELELIYLFPQARILRMDADTTRRKNSHQKIYKLLKSGQIDILVGTQMISKGWDLPNIKTIGIISADSLLNLPDFKTAEFAFQTLTQVAGRTGRGREKGQVFLQTYHPENKIIRAAANHDYQKFFAAEIVERRKHLYPPFAKLIHLIIKGKNETKTAEKALALHRQLVTNFDPAWFIGPAPMFIPRKNDYFYFHLIVKAPPTTPLNNLLNIIPDEWTIDVDPISIT